MAKFRTKARAVDMLGRQQIADASTAISELFKNAHDAYADHVEVDFFRSDSLLVIRDDGIGMTLKEFDSNWLVLGTDSKIVFPQGTQPHRPPDKPERAIMGEKGIGWIEGCTAETFSVAALYWPCSHSVARRYPGLTGDCRWKCT